jgi:MFS family permease
MNDVLKRTLALQRTAAPFEGILWASLQLSPTIARKSLGASDFEIMLMMMVAPLCFLLSVYWSQLIGVIKNWKRLFLITGAVGILPLSIMYSFGSMRVLLGLLLLYELGNSLHIPLRNRLMQINYPPEKRSSLYGRIASYMSLTMLLISWPAGRFLDLDPYNWRWIFVIAAVAGLIDRLLWFLIPLANGHDRKAAPIASPDWMGQPWIGWSTLTRPILQMADVLTRNKHFFRWEMQFMLYGLAFFIIITILPGYLVDGLNLSYSEISTGQIALSRMGGVLALPFMGRYHDKNDPASFCAKIFLLLAMFPLLMWLCGVMPDNGLRLLPFYLAFFFQGIAMSGVMVAWTMSSISFAGKEDAALYQGIHVTLTGVRGMFGPMIGWMMREYFGWSAAFVLASILLVTAAGLMLHQSKELKCWTADCVPDN